MGSHHRCVVVPWGPYSQSQEEVDASNLPAEEAPTAEVGDNHGQQVLGVGEHRDGSRVAREEGEEVGSNLRIQEVG